MEYNAPVLVEVGQAANVVLGFPLLSGDNGSETSQAFELALGLDE